MPASAEQQKLKLFQNKKGDKTELVGQIQLESKEDII